MDRREIKRNKRVSGDIYEKEKKERYIDKKKRKSTHIDKRGQIDTCK